MPVNFDQVNDNIYRGGEPNLIDIQLLKDVFGIKRIISLDEKIANKIHPIVESLGIEHIIIPMYYEGPPSEGDFLSKLYFVYNNIENLFSIKTYVHCRHGSDRTGAVVALYRLFVDGCELDNVIFEMLKYEFGVRASKEFSDAVINFFYKTLGDTNSAYDDLQKSYEGSIFGTDPGGVPPITNSQPSFSLIEPIDFGITENYINRENQAKEERLKYLKHLHDQMLSGDVLKNAPMIGSNESYPGIRGIGPVENIGFIGFP